MIVYAVPNSPGAARVQAHGDFHARLTPQGLDADLHAVDGPRHFNLRVDEGLSTLAGGFERKLLGTLAHDGGGPIQNVDTLFGIHPAGTIAIKAVGGSQRMVDCSLVRRVERGDGCPVIGGGHLQA